MNKQEINSFRVAHGLAPLPATDTRAKAVRQNRNKAARAQACRDLKALRSRNKKA